MSVRTWLLNSINDINFLLTRPWSGGPFKERGSASNYFDYWITASGCLFLILWSSHLRSFKPRTVAIDWLPFYILTIAVIAVNVSGPALSSRCRWSESRLTSPSRNFASRKSFTKPRQKFASERSWWGFSSGRPKPSRRILKRTFVSALVVREVAGSVLAVKRTCYLCCFCPIKIS